MFTSCHKENRWDCVKSTGTIIKQTRTIPEIHTIDIDNKLNVFITQDTVNSLVVEAGKNIIDNIETSVIGDRLLIKNNNKCNFMRSYKAPITIYVSIKNLTTINYLGGGTVKSTNTLICDTLTINCSNGSDTVKLDVNANTVQAFMHTGVADIIISGKCNRAFAYSRGQGFIRLQNLESSYVYCNSSGTGDFYVWADNEMEILLQYVGNVYYKGNPKITIDTHTGKGNLIVL